MPFTADEIQAMVKAWACDSYDGPNRPLLKALVLLLRYSGLRIRDAVTLKRADISEGRLLLRSTKTVKTELSLERYPLLTSVWMENANTLQSAKIRAR